MMDKKRATLLLARELSAKGNINLIEDQAVKRYLLENESSSSFIVSTEPVAESAAVLYESWATFTDVNGRKHSHYVAISPRYENEPEFENLIPRDKKERNNMTYLGCDGWGEVRRQAELHSVERCRELVKDATGELGANYVFTTKFINQYQNYWACLTEGFPMAIITSKEVEELKHIYKGDPPAEIEEAADVLDIDISVDYTKLYQNEPDTFKEYFSGVSDEKREQELRRIVDADLRNEELEKWLSKEYKELSKRIASEMVMVVSNNNDD